MLKKSLGSVLLCVVFVLVMESSALAQGPLKLARRYDLSELELSDQWKDGQRFALGRNPATSSGMSFEEDEDESDPARAVLDFVKFQLADVDWNQKGLYELNDGVLTIVAVPALHGRVRRVLSSLAESASERARVTLTLLTLRERAGSFRDFHAGLSLDDKKLRSLEKETLSKEGVLFFDVANGAVKVCEKLSGRNFLGDYEVNQTGVVPVINPVVQVLRVGLAGEVQAHWDGDSKDLLLEARFELCRQLSTETVPFFKKRPLELPEVARMRLGCSVRVPMNSTTVLSQFIDEFGKRRMILATVRSKRQGELAWRRYSLRGYGALQDFESYPWVSEIPGGGGGGGGGTSLNFGDEEEEDEELVQPEKQLFDALFKKATVGARAIGSWLFVKGAKLQDYVALALRNRLEKRARVAYRVMELEFPTGTLPEARRWDAESFAKLMALGKVSREMTVSGFAGQPVQLDLFVEKRYVSAVSTAAGACLILDPTPDPIVKCLRRGYRLVLNSKAGAKDSVSFAVKGQQHSYGAFRRSPMTYGVVQFPQALEKRDLNETGEAKWGQWALLSLEVSGEKTRILCVRLRKLP